MAEILLFHHVQGLTPGVHELAERLRSGGHTVHTPDLYDGRTFTEMSEGAAFARAQTDRDEVVDRLVADLPESLVHAGISSGVMSAQRLAQTRPGAAGAVLLEACLPVSGEWAIGPWPDGVPVQVHGMDDDEFFAHEGDLDAARELVATASDAELFTYPGSGHLFVDSSLPSYDAAATDLVVERVLGMLARL
ncbi:dienelactone hydrolase family protein [Nocardioides flavescens]|uniref:Dienelactone hydrolase n=1 Tax=Nocardioides flavescens TaxID=2691959 RepID=A0A6L7F1X9_9ACTN|nr:dienelactone hydrolase family protein [Nocardioides flavescens]MXG91041.1 dienelactone hydrolase [Nocardioides flavescens]